jgi:hypothetical protein
MEKISNHIIFMFSGLFFFLHLSCENTVINSAYYFCLWSTLGTDWKFLTNFTVKIINEQRLLSTPVGGQEADE